MKKTAFKFELSVSVKGLLIVTFFVLTLILVLTGNSDIVQSVIDKFN